MGDTYRVHGEQLVVLVRKLGQNRWFTRNVHLERLFVWLPFREEAEGGGSKTNFWARRQQRTANRTSYYFIDNLRARGTPGPIWGGGWAPGWPFGASSEVENDRKYNDISGKCEELLGNRRKY